METVLSGMRATSHTHLGNYFGAGINYVKMQYEHNCYFFVADLHSLTTNHNPKEIQENVKGILANYLAIGVDPEQCTLYIQSHVPEIQELYLILNMFAHKGELEKTASFKEKARKKGQTLNAGLLTYPVLMASDILIHRASLVPVGKDQEQHLEMTRTFANRFNHIYKTDFLPEPQAFNYGESLIKVLALDGSGSKMSKSDSNTNNTIYLSDDPDLIRKKIRKAKTDGGPKEPNQPMDKGVEGLFSLMQLVSSNDIYNDFLKEYSNCTIRYGDFKNQLAEDIITFTDPFREKIKVYLNDTDYLKKVCKIGTEKARESADKTITGVKKVMGLNYF